MRRNTGTPTTNQTSREANRKIRAPASTLTARLLENICVNLADRFGVPRSPRISARVPSKADRTSPASISSAVWNPTVLSSRPPRKKPTPFSAFFEPVRTATHLYSAPGVSSGTTSFTALLELILVRSLAMPESAWATIT